MIPDCSHCRWRFLSYVVGICRHYQSLGLIRQHAIWDGSSERLLAEILVHEAGLVIDPTAG